MAAEFIPTPEIVRDAENMFMAMAIARGNPTKRALDLQRMAENVFIDSMAGITGIPLKKVDGGPYRAKLLELASELVKPFVGSADAILTRFGINKSKEGDHGTETKAQDNSAEPRAEL
jgi:hypothetical protein